MMSIKEIKLRGAIELILDITTSDGFLPPYLEYFSNFKKEGIINCINSAILGAAYNFTLNQYFIMKRNLGEEVTNEDKKKFDEMFLRRVPVIKSKIELLSNL